MQIQNTKRMQERMVRLIADRNLNAMVAKFLTGSVAGSGAPESMEALRTAGASYKETVAKNGLTLNDDQAAVCAMIHGLTGEHRKELFRNAADEKYVIGGIAQNARVFAADAFTSNPYLETVKINGANAGEYRLGQLAFRPGQLFFYNTPRRIRPRTVELPRVGCFSEQALFPAILKDRRAVKSVTPNEILTVQPHVDAARGNVLALGGGLGYFAFMAAGKPEVQTVTVIEQDPAIVELLEEHLIPQMGDFADKIRVLEDDPVEFLSDLDDEIYDRCFLNYGDLDTYLKIVKLCRRFEKMKSTFWIEDAFCINLVTYVYLAILNAYYESIGKPAPDYGSAPQAEKDRLAFVEELLKDAKIQRPEQIDYYMDPTNLVYLIR